MKFTISIISATLSLLLYSCATKATADSSTPSPQQAASPQLALPVVPDSLTSIPDRAAYATLHYWDSLDFTSGTASCDTMFMEQNFANFAALLSMAAPEAVDTAVEKVIDSAANGSRRAFDLLCFIAAKYLDDPNSPMRNEELYIPFLRHIVKSPILSPQEQLRPAYRLEQALKNRPGLMATDFAFDLRGGGEATLRSLRPQAAMTLLVFYDPDCDHCKEIMAEIARTPLRPGVRVLAVDFVGDRDQWLRTADSLPQSWTVGFATTPVEDEGLYSFPASPTIYLIDNENRVVLKDPDYRVALNYIAAK